MAGAIQAKIGTAAQIPARMACKSHDICTATPKRSACGNGELSPPTNARWRETPTMKKLTTPILACAIFAFLPLLPLSGCGQGQGQAAPTGAEPAGTELAGTELAIASFMESRYLEYAARQARSRPRKISNRS
jgi:hypothetical protein